MAVLYITEFAAQMRDDAGYVAPAPDLPVVAEQTVAIGAGSVASSAFNAKTRFIRLCADAVCSVAFGTSPTAAATNMRLPANVPYDLGVPKGASYKVAVITNT